MSTKFSKKNWENNQLVLNKFIYKYAIGKETYVGMKEGKKERNGERENENEILILMDLFSYIKTNIFSLNQKKKKMCLEKILKRNRSL